MLIASRDRQVVEKQIGEHDAAADPSPSQARSQGRCPCKSGTAHSPYRRLVRGLVRHCRSGTLSIPCRELRPWLADRPGDLGRSLRPAAILFELVIWNARRRFKQAALELRPIHYCLHDDGMDVSSVKRSGWIPWEAFQESVEIPSSFLLFLEKGEYYLLPKRCFERPNEVDGLRDLLQTEFAHSSKS